MVSAGGFAGFVSIVAMRAGKGNWKPRGKIEASARHKPDAQIACVAGDKEDTRHLKWPSRDQLVTQTA